MSNEWLFAIMVAGTFIGMLCYGAWVSGRQRQAVAGRFGELEIKSVAARLGIDLDPESIGKSSEGDRLLSAMVQCDKCQSAEACHAFPEDDAANGKKLAAFCPNAIYLLGPHGWQHQHRNLAWYA